MCFRKDENIVGKRGNGDHELFLLFNNVFKRPLLKVLESQKCAVMD